MQPKGPKNLPLRLGNAQTNPVFVGWEWRARARAINNGVVTAGEERSLPLHTTGPRTAVKVKSKTNLEKPKAKTRMRAKDQIPGNCALLCRVGSGQWDTADCPLVSASSFSVRCQSRIGMGVMLESMPTRLPWRPARGRYCVCMERRQWSIKSGPRRRLAADRGLCSLGELLLGTGALCFFFSSSLLLLLENCGLCV